MDTTPSPEQIANVTEAINVTLWFGVVLIIYIVMAYRPADGRPSRGQRLSAWLRAVYHARYPDGLFVMSRLSDDDDLDRAVVPPVDQQATIAGQRIAKPGNEGNGELSGNNPLPLELSVEARDIIRFAARVEALAALIRDGQVTNKAKGIERVFGCARSSKPDSTYQRAHRALEPLLTTEPMFAQNDGTTAPASYPISGARRSS